MNEQPNKPLDIPRATIAHAEAAMRQVKGCPEGELPCEGFDGPCANMNAARQRQNTAYADDDRNRVTLCPECMKACDEYWKEMWSDYYGGCL